MKNIFVIVLCLLDVLFAGSFKDSRDGKVYKTVKIGDQIWMAQNLNYDMKESGCYGNSERNCKKYGRLYSWHAARFACPNGWHLPDKMEWDELYDNVGGFEIAAKMLKSKKIWKKDDSGVDAYGFSALPAGEVRSGSFWGLGFAVYFWTSSVHVEKKSSMAS